MSVSLATAIPDPGAGGAVHAGRERSLPTVGVQNEDRRLPPEELGVDLLLGLGLALVASLRQY
jgi:hypothetical protein